MRPSQGIALISVTCNGLTFNCRTAGAAEGMPVILLHGWPETSQMWEPQMLRLASEGYRCIAPDMRGFSPGARPVEVAGYDVRMLSGDVISIADTLGMGRFHLIGHDWGAAIGWATVTLHSDRFLSWTAMSVPHLPAFADAIRNDPRQRMMSRYMGWFQWPWLPEWFLLRNGAKALRDVWRRSNPEQVAAYLSVLGNKEALKASLNYYRANYGMLTKGDEVYAFGDISVPTLMLWGKRDFAIGPVGVLGTARYMKGPYRLVELEATHWLVQEAPEPCTQEIMAHLASTSR
ncbi:MAG: alpha/beta fold hydrolase [Flavobacteriales bacterium]|nr:alpha/beta fold hydrolase [Flavobacteriales bacterium]